MKNIIEFRLITVLSNNSFVSLGKKETNIIPNKNSIININGNPFIVYDVGTATDTTYDMIKSPTNEFTHTYVFVFKAGTYKLKIGENEY